MQFNINGGVGYVYQRTSGHWCVTSVVPRIHVESLGRESAVQEFQAVAALDFGIKAMPVVDAPERLKP